MKREIKFEYGFESVNGTVKKAYHLNEIPRIHQKCDVWNILELKYVRQSTGIKDKNCIEIYEGDYLVDRYPVDDENLDAGYHESLLPVVWCSRKLQWCVDVSFAKDGSYLNSLVEYFGNHLEVKGNIYENPQP